MPRYINTFSPDTDLGRGLAGISDMLFGGSTPNQDAKLDIERMAARSHAEYLTRQGMKTMAETTGLYQENDKKQYYNDLFMTPGGRGRLVEMARARYPGATDEQLRRIVAPMFGELPGGVGQPPAAPGLQGAGVAGVAGVANQGQPAAVSRGTMPVPPAMPGVTAPSVETAPSEYGPSQGGYMQKWGTSVGAFPPEYQISGVPLEGGQYSLGGHELPPVEALNPRAARGQLSLDELLAQSPLRNPPSNPDVGEHGLPPMIEEIISALLGNYGTGKPGGEVRIQPAERPGATAVLSGNQMDIPPVDVARSDLVARPEAQTTAPVAPPPLGASKAPIGAPVAPGGLGAGAATVAPANDPLLQRYLADFLMAVFNQWQDKTSDPLTFSRAVGKNTENVRRDQAFGVPGLPGITTEQYAQDQMAELGHPLYHMGDAGTMNQATGTVTPTPLSGAKVGAEQAQAGRDAAHGRDYDAKALSEVDRRLLMRAQAGQANRSPREAAGDKPKNLTATQRKALHNAVDAKTVGGNPLAPEAKQELHSLAGDYMRQPGGDEQDDEVAAVERAFAELYPNGDEDFETVDAPGFGWGFGGNIAQPKKKAAGGGTAGAAPAGKPAAAPAGKPAGPASGGLPLPKSMAEMVDGQTYATARGPARWEAKTRSFVK